MLKCHIMYSMPIFFSFLFFMILPSECIYLAAGHYCTYDKRDMLIIKGTSKFSCDMLFAFLLYNQCARKGFVSIGKWCGSPPTRWSYSFKKKMFCFVALIKLSFLALSSWGFSNVIPCAPLLLRGWPFQSLSWLETSFWHEECNERPLYIREALIRDRRYQIVYVMYIS